MSGDRPHLQVVPGPTRDELEGSVEPGTERPAGLLAEALEAASDDGPEDPPVRIVALAPPADGDPAATFLEMVERVEKVAPLHGDKTRLAPEHLLRIIGAVGGGAPAATQDASVQAALRERLAATAWEAVRAGAADHDPELRALVVHVCTRLVPGS